MWEIVNNKQQRVCERCCLANRQYLEGTSRIEGTDYDPF